MQMETVFKTTCVLCDDVAMFVKRTARRINAFLAVLNAGMAAAHQAEAGNHRAAVEIINAHR
jgi:predicted DCC family thiol-disulfide oxidoreductase YuxK